MIILALGNLAFLGIIAAVAAVGVLFAKSGTDPSTTAKPDAPDVTLPPGTAVVPKDVLPAAQAPAGVPSEILAGGVVPPEGWETYAWYSYKGQWIRVDLGPRPLNDPQKRVASNLPEGTPLAAHYTKFFRRWRWSVIAGEATPLGTALTNGAFETMARGDYPEEQASLDEISDVVARLASDWIDTVT